MVQISLAPVSEEDMEELLPALLPEDSAEILAMGFSPEWGIRNSVETSLECVAIRESGRLAALFGVSEPIALADPRPWLLATAVIREHPIEFLWLSRKIISRWRGMFPYMVNYVDARHCRATTWLRWLGAELTLEPEFGPYRRPFYKFEFGEPPCVSQQ